MLSVFSQVDRKGLVLAIEQAYQAARVGEVPVGAVVLDAQGQVLGQGYNLTITGHDPTAHAEIVALRQASSRLGNYRLPDTRLYVTLEPCVMCMGAIMHARIGHVVFGASDPKTGACGSVLDVSSIAQINHHTQVAGGLMAPACGQLLSDFFRRRRVEQRLRKHLFI